MPEGHKRVQDAKEESQASAVPQDDRQEIALPESEEDTDQSVSARRSAEEAQLPEWTLEAEANNTLLVGKALIISGKLDCYILKNLGSLQAVGGDEDVWMQMLTRYPYGKSDFGRHWRELIGMGGYGFLLDAQRLMSDVKNLYCEGAISLRQWKDFGSKDTVSPLGRAKLNEALSQVLNEEGRSGRYKKSKETRGIMRVRAECEVWPWRGSSWRRREGNGCEGEATAVMDRQGSWPNPRKE
ncbi:retrotransposon hot spot (RHS) protein, putative [Trypanosoma cruzi marinkellei]|uniref:Retrotransposon hot spot (RHS) protein, putative n=1 Tax=Trypanosoma cruzi marinkellei TaxID=85056 RepID=K2NLF6_TRYCR|nr:retrotransposon hot spot (RHS) protein, putative [Trypanosoma cruzi marinkellei]